MSILIGDAWVGTAFLGPDPVSEDLLRTLAEKLEDKTFKLREVISWQKKFGDTHPAYFSEGVVIWLSTSNTWRIQHFVVNLNSKQPVVINADKDVQYTKEGAEDWVDNFARNTHMHEFVNGVPKIKEYMGEAVYDTSLAYTEEQIGSCEERIITFIKDVLNEHTDRGVSDVSFDYDCLHEGSFRIIVEVGGEDGD